jgi:hypothetical protein
MVELSNAKAEEYRRCAVRAEEKARTVHDSEASKIYHEIARQWLDMAEQVERRGW